eukprot:gnl/TRDRNA2_/TRDRNA2_175511_c0_seq2.p1 gnl/TRDRNA2_/TRDRNA2_175511_c0~~gnl/TRDRNA2_/TRDRNA2_175511_c0_seq2.p1  ORF type:complete len:305 (+),score=39.92 gnl/TRDRNA2_/TRDRNA2_175511_c0_seq2:71-985(+)
MANVQDCYYLTPSECMDSQRVTSGGWFKSSLAFLCGSCLVLSSILALSACTLTLQSPSTSQSTSLVSVLNSKNRFAASPLTSYKSSLNNQPRGFRVPARASLSEFKAGQKAEYNSASNNRWVPCTVEKVYPNGDVEINIKKGYKLDLQTQQNSMRKQNAFAAFFSGDFIPQDSYDASAALSSDEYVDGSMAQGYARAREQRKLAMERERAEREGTAKGPGLFNQITGALDFQENIKEDRGLLDGARNMRKGEKMSREQYGAVRRKIGGTSGGFFGETVEAEGKYLEKGYVAEDETETPWWKRLR